MRRSLILALAVLAVGTGVPVRDAGAQTVTSVEVGADVSASIGSWRATGQLGPRLVVNFGERNALQFTSSLQKLTTFTCVTQRKVDSHLAVYRRLLYADGRARVFATLGGGIERTVYVALTNPFGFPPSKFVRTLPAFTTGAGIDFRLGKRVAIVLESSLVFARDTPRGQFSAGLVVPLRPYAARGDRLPSAVPWAALDQSHRAWITTGDGREVDGEVVTRSATTLTLRTRTGIVLFNASDVRAIDTTDSIRNGVVRGTTIGVLSGLGTGFFIASLFCEIEHACGAGEKLGTTVLFTGVGAGIGASMGALFDSLLEDRVPLYRRGASTSVTLTPIVGAHRLGGGAVIRW